MINIKYCEGIAFKNLSYQVLTVALLSSQMLYPATAANPSFQPNVFHNPNPVMVRPPMPHVAIPMPQVPHNTVAPTVHHAPVMPHIAPINNVDYTHVNTQPAAAMFRGPVPQGDSLSKQVELNVTGKIHFSNSQPGNPNSVSQQQPDQNSQSQQQQNTSTHTLSTLSKNASSNSQLSTYSGIKPSTLFGGIPSRSNVLVQRIQAVQTKPTAITLSKSVTGSLLGDAVISNPLGLDLTLNQAVVPANITHPVTIIVGGSLGANGHITGARQEMVIRPGQMLTPAQYAAMEQVVTSGHQTLVVNNQGVAVGGLITVAAGQTGVLSQAVIPKGVILDTVGFSASNPLAITGSLQVFGSVYALQPTANATANFTLGSVVIGSQGTLSTGLSTSLPISLGSSNGVFSSSGLSLNILGSLMNQGSISSAGTLSIMSGGSISNISTAGSRASISAPSLNLYSATGSVSNTGLIAATAGNVQFNAPSSQNISINNTGGTISATQGAINVRNTLYNGAGNVDLNGGNWLANQLNVYSGSGTINANIGNITGPLNTYAGAAHVIAATNNLIIGTTCITGDPSFFNTAGSVTIAAPINFSGQDLAIVANTNILTASGAGIINTSSSTGNGGNITMIAGANFTSSGAGSGSNDTTSTLTISGGTAAGGYIDLHGVVSGSGAAITSLSSASTAANGQGGNISLVAYGGTATSAGTINLPANVAITSGGHGTGSNGAVTVLAGAQSGTSINLGNINTTGGTGGGGTITIGTQDPNISGAANMTIVNGSITNGTSYTGGTVQAAGIVTGSLTAPGANISITAGGPVNVGDINTNGINGGVGGSVNITAAGQTITGTYISANGGATGNGGSITTVSDNLVLTGQNINGNSIDVSSANSSAGAISVNTTSTLTFTVGNGDTTGNGTAGNINASGVSGGSIVLTNAGTLPNGDNQVINGSVLANGTSGTAGSILFQGVSGGGLSTTINGLVQAIDNSGTTGLIGFSSGPNQDVNLLGSGTVNAGNAVRIGNLDPNSLALLDQPAGSITTASSLTVGNTIQTNGNVVLSPPPPPPVDNSVFVPADMSAVVTDASLTPNTTASSAVSADVSLISTDTTQTSNMVNSSTRAATTMTIASIGAGPHQQTHFVYEYINSLSATVPSQIIQGTTIYAADFGVEEIDRLAYEGVYIGGKSANNYLELEQGNIFLSPDTDTLVGTPESQVLIHSGASVFIIKSALGVVVYDLFQNPDKPVSVIVNRQKFDLQPGNMAVLTKCPAKNFASLPVNCHSISYSHDQKLDLYGNVKAYVANFSMTAALLAVAPLQRLAMSNCREDQMMIERLIKSVDVVGYLPTGASMP